jgi:hypothetical protein
MSADEEQNESAAKRRRPFGGQPSRIEIYAIAVVVFLLAVGGISSAAVISSGDSASSTTTTTTSVPAPALGDAEPEAPPATGADSGVVTATTAQPSSGSVNPPSAGGSAALDPALQRLIDQQVEAERLAKARADYLDWAKSNPITRINSVQVLSQTCSAPDSGDVNTIQIRFSYTNFGYSHFLGAADPSSGNGQQYGVYHPATGSVSWPESSKAPGSHSEVLTLRGPAVVRSGLVLFGTFANQNPATASEPVPSARNINFRVPLDFAC